MEKEKEQGSLPKKGEIKQAHELLDGASLKGTDTETLVAVARALQSTRAVHESVAGAAKAAVEKYKQAHEEITEQMQRLSELRARYKGDAQVFTPGEKDELLDLAAKERELSDFVDKTAADLCDEPYGGKIATLTAEQIGKLFAGSDKKAGELLAVFGVYCPQKEGKAESEGA